MKKRLYVIPAVVVGRAGDLRRRYLLIVAELRRQLDPGDVLPKPVKWVSAIGLEHVELPGQDTQQRVFAQRIRAGSLR